MKKKMHIGFSHFRALFWSLVSHHVREEAEKLGIEFTIVTGSDISDQINGIERLRHKKIDALLVVPSITGNQPLIDLTTTIRRSGTPVISIGSEIGNDCESGFVASDNFGGYSLVLEYLFKAHQGKGKIAHLAGLSNLGAHSIRFKAFHHLLAQYPNIEVVFEQTLGKGAITNPYQLGKTYTLEALQLHPDICAIAAASDVTALGIIDALEEIGLSGKVDVIGFDGVPTGLAAIYSGKLKATGRQSAMAIAQEALKMALKNIRGEEVSKKILTPVELITIDNVSPALVKALETIPSMLFYVAESYAIQQQLLMAQESTLATLRESESRFRSLTQLSSDWYWEQDENYRFTFHSQTALGLTDRDPVDYRGKHRWDYPALNMTEENWKKHIAVLDARQPFYDFVLKRQRDEGEVIYVSISGQPILDESGAFKGYRGIGKNITEQKKAEERIQYLAYHDDLTSLANRGFFVQQVNHAIAKAKRHKNSQLAILFIDLDRFKNINDTLGHSAGDRLLQEVAKRITNALRESDTVARLGGDEFVVLVEDMTDLKYAAFVAHRILSSIVRPIMIVNREFQITASIGISSYPTDGEDEETLMKNADIAMYLAKEQGTNNYQFYSVQTNSHTVERLALESSLRRALDNNEFALHYQPRVDIHTGTVTGIEALIRWIRPNIGMVSPAQFIPIAEETGLIVPIGKWVLRTACEQHIAWQRQGIPELRMAVNLSPRQFNDASLVHDIAMVLRDTGMKPDLLELEITETTMMHNTEKTVKLLAELKAMGIYLAIDDFGTGYSSLAILKKFPIDIIKIDRSFVKDLPEDAEDSAITNAIISMGRALDLQIVAEGVETLEQLIFLRDHACDQMQGFYFSKPIPADELAVLLKKTKSGVAALFRKDFDEQ